MEFGIGLDVTVLTETTEALIETRNGVATTVTAGGNVIVDASSSEDIFQLTVNAGAGDSTSGAGGLNVLVTDTTTRALVGRDPARRPLDDRHHHDRCRRRRSSSPPTARP